VPFRKLDAAFTRLAIFSVSPVEPNPGVSESGKQLSIFPPAPHVPAAV
jgi:hypothetical protein